MDLDSSQKTPDTLSTSPENSLPPLTGTIPNTTDNSEPIEPIVKSVAELCQELTGQNIDEDPEEVVYTMMQDRKEIAAKYGVPLLDPEGIKEKYKALEEIAMQNNAPIAYVDDSKLEAANLRGGVTSEGKIVIAKIDVEKSTPVELYNRAVDLEHELLHILQDLKFPQMSVEEKEYEAYVLTYLPTTVTTYSGYPEGYIQLYMIATEMFEHMRNSSIGYKKAVQKKSQRLGI